MSILLIEKGAAFSGKVGKWLETCGFEMRRAKDFGHALEAMSDFTVRLRPDIVIMEVSALNENFESLHNAFQSSSATDDITVFALSDKDGPPRRKSFFARDLEQLKTVFKNARVTYSYMS